MKRLRHRVLACAAILLLARILAGAQMDEYSIKAAYLYNFSKYVEWPDGSFAEPSSPLMICIVGEDPFEGKLDQAVAGRTAGNGRSLSVRRMKATDLESMKQCQILFLAHSERQRAGEIVNAVREHSVLTVADFSPFAEESGIADLRIDGTKVKVDLNMNAAGHANLRISGKLQQVANLVSKNK